MPGKSFLRDQIGSVAVNDVTVPFTVHGILAKIQKNSEETEFHM